MALRKISEKLASGEVPEIYLGNTNPESKVPTQGEVDAADALKADAADLTNVDNTSDADKPISDATQVALDTKAGTENIPQIGFAPQDPPPARVEGVLFYDDKLKVLSTYNDQDMTLNLGQEEIIRVRNDTGVTIPNATPVYLTGVVANGIPSVAPAQANLLTTAIVPGITTHELLDTNEGFITHAGRLGGDFSAFAVGDKLYLSDTLPGGLVTTPPDLATTIGTVLDNAVEGALLVRIGSLVALPTLIAYMNEALDPPGGTIGAAYQDVDNFQDSDNVGIVYDALAGTITLPANGVYRVSFNLSMTFTPSASSRTFSLQLWNQTAASAVFTIPTSITKDVANYDSTISAPFTGVGGDTYVFQVLCPAGLAGVAYNFVSFDIESVHIQ